MIRKALSLIVTFGLLAISVAGCRTVQATANGIFKPYAGSGLDSYIVTHPQSSTMEKLGAAVDYPFSLGGDVLLLAFTIPLNGITLSNTSPLNE